MKHIANRNKDYNIVSSSKQNLFCRNSYDMLCNMALDQTISLIYRRLSNLIEASIWMMTQIFGTLP